MSLNDLGLKYCTDKSSSGHGYLYDYELLIPSSVSAVLELGVHKGGSLRMWRDYYPSATIVGVDVDLGCMVTGEDRISTVCMDTMDIDGFDVSSFDLVVDDGSHKWLDQLRNFFSIFPRLESGSVYILEDLHTSNHSSYNDGFITPKWIMEHLDVFSLVGSWTWVYGRDDGVSLVMVRL